jgi:hypothetical protein
MAAATASDSLKTPSTNHDSTLVYQELLSFLQSPQRPDLRLEATKAVLHCVPDRNESLSLIEHGVLKPLLQIVSMGSGVAANASATNSSNANTMVVQATLNALKSLLYWTSSAQEITNMVVEKMLENKAIPRLVELILDFPAVADNIQLQSSLSKDSKQIINMALAILANLSRMEQGAVELVGTTLPEEAIYSNKMDPSEEEADTTRIKPTMELLLDRFIKTKPINIIDESVKEAMAVGMESQNEWDALWYPFDPYQHFAAILMNATQIKAGRQFVMKIPRTAASSEKAKRSALSSQQSAAQSQSVLQRLLPQLAPPTSVDAVTNPFRRRGISGMIRNCCLEKESAWWLLNVCRIITPLLLPLAGPEELDMDEKRGLDPDLWMRGPDQQRDVDTATRQHCVEAVLLLCASGRASRNTLRVAKTYIILKYCDMVEESEDVSDRINECVQYLRRDEEGTFEGSSDQLVEEAINGEVNHKFAGLLEASSSSKIRAAGVGNDEDYDDVD